MNKKDKLKEEKEASKLVDFYHQQIRYYLDKARLPFGAALKKAQADVAKWLEERKK